MLVKHNINYKPTCKHVQVDLPYFIKYMHVEDRICTIKYVKVWRI